MCGAGVARDLSPPAAPPPPPTAQSRRAAFVAHRAVIAAVSVGGDCGELAGTPCDESSAVRSVPLRRQSPTGPGDRR